jgi:photosystem II stability/assembly factor-like uncharacterized protein
MKKTLLILSLCLPVLGFTQSWSDQNSSITNDLNDVAFVDNNNGWAVGRQGKIVHTTNGGATWAEQNSGTTNDLQRVSMVSSTSGYAVGATGTVIKYNGSTWSTLNISFSQDMYGVYFLDSNTGWVSGDWGRIMMTTNGGSTWTIQMDNSTYSNTFRDLAMLSATEGWAVGSSGKVLKYNGSSWSSVSNPATANLTDLYAVGFSGSGNGFTSGQNSTMYQWDGSSWNTQNTALPDNSFHVYDLCMLSSSLGYAVTTPGFGGGGVILKYNGNTWASDYAYTGMNSELFTGVTATPNGNIYAVGATGMIKMKGTGGTTPTGIAINNANASGLQVYPNPFTSAFTISLPASENGNVTVALKDLTGKLVKTSSTAVTNSTIVMDGNDLTSGLYFYTVITPHTIVTGKLVKH